MSLRKILTCNLIIFQLEIQKMKKINESNIWYFIIWLILWKNQNRKVAMSRNVYMEKVLTFNSILVSYNCSKKLSQTWRLKTTEMCSPTVLEARSLKSRYPTTTIFEKALGRDCILCNFLEAVCIQMAASLQSCLCFHIAFSSISSHLLHVLNLGLSFTSTSVIGFRP